MVQLVLNELVGVAQLGELHFLLLDNERRQLPFALLFVPLSAVLDLVHLLVSHQVLGYLLQEVKFFCLFPDRVEQLLVALGILIMDVLELVIGSFELLLQLLDYLSAVFHFLLYVIVLLLLFQQLRLLPFLLLQEQPLLVLFLLELQLHLPLGLRLLPLLLLESIATRDKLRLHLLEEVLEFLTLLGLLCQGRIRLLYYLLLLGLLLKELLCRLYYRIFS